MPSLIHAGISKKGPGVIQYPKLQYISPDSKVHGANMGPTWVLQAPDGPHVDPMNLAIRVGFCHHAIII